MRMLKPSKIPTCAKVHEIRAYPEEGVTIDEMIENLKRLGNEVKEINRVAGYVVIYQGGGKCDG